MNKSTKSEQLNNKINVSVITKEESHIFLHLSDTHIHFLTAIPLIPNSALIQSYTHSLKGAPPDGQAVPEIWL